MTGKSTLVVILDTFRCDNYDVTRCSDYEINDTNRLYDLENISSEYNYKHAVIRNLKFPTVKNVYGHFPML